MSVFELNWQLKNPGRILKNQKKSNCFCFAWLGSVVFNHFIILLNCFYHIFVLFFIAGMFSSFSFSTGTLVRLHSPPPSPRFEHQFDLISFSID